MGVFLDPEAFLCTISQDDIRIEEYVEEFLEYWSLMARDDHVFIHCFRSGMDDDACQLLPT